MNSLLLSIACKQTLSSHGPKITEFSWIAPQTKSPNNYQGVYFHTSGLIGKLKKRSVRTECLLFCMQAHPPHLILCRFSDSFLAKKGQALELAPKLACR